MKEIRRRAAHYAPLVLVLAAFFGSRAYYRLVLGAHFDASPLDHFVQFADKELLRDDLLRTCWYLQHQAPFLNLLSGVALKIAPDRYPLFLDACYAAGAITVTLSLFSILESLGVRRWLAALATIAYCVSPAVVFYELWLLYHHFVVVFLMLSIVALLRFLRKETLGSGVLFFTALALVVLTRATFGLVYMASVAGVLLHYRPVARRLVLTSALAPMLAVGLYTLKPILQTGHSLGHALIAPNLAQKILHEIPVDERARLFASGAIDPMEREEPFPNLARAPKLRVAKTPWTGVPTLDELTTKNGNVNANALQYDYLADVAAKDVRFLIRRYPAAYLRGVESAFFVGYFRPSTSDVCAPRSPAYKALAPVDERVKKLFRLRQNDVLPLLLVVIPLSLLYAVAKLLSPRSFLPSRRSATPVIAVLLLTIVYASSSLLISYGDFSRYRFEVDILYAILFTLCLEDALATATAFARRAWEWRRDRRHGRDLVLVKS